MANGARRRRRGRRRQGINKKVFLLFLPFHLTVVEASPFVLPYFFIMQTEISLKERERTSIKEKIKGNVNVGGPIPTGPKGKKKKKRQMRQRETHQGYDEGGKAPLNKKKKNLFIIHDRSKGRNQRFNNQPFAFFRLEFSLFSDNILVLISRWKQLNQKDWGGRRW